MYQQVHNQHSAGLVHLDGLFQMIQLRGGICRLLKENRALALKALRCVLILATLTILAALPLQLNTIPMLSLRVLGQGLSKIL